MPRKIRDRDFIDDILTEPQTLPELSMLDDVRRTVAYQYVYDGNRFIRRPVPGAEERQIQAYTYGSLAAGASKTVFEATEPSVGYIDGITFYSDTPAAKLQITFAGTTLQVPKSDATAMVAVTPSNLNDIGGDSPPFKLIIYDATNNKYGIMVNERLGFNKPVKVVMVNGAGTSQNLAITMNWRLVHGTVTYYSGTTAEEEGTGSGIFAPLGPVLEH